MEDEPGTSKDDSKTSFKESDADTKAEKTPKRIFKVPSDLLKPSSSEITETEEKDKTLPASLDASTSKTLLNDNDNQEEKPLKSPRRVSFEDDETSAETAHDSEEHSILLSNDSGIKNSDFHHSQAKSLSEVAKDKREDHKSVKTVPDFKEASPRATEESTIDMPEEDVVEKKSAPSKNRSDTDILQTSLQINDSKALKQASEDPEKYLKSSSHPSKTQESISREIPEKSLEYKKKENKVPSSEEMPSSQMQKSSTQKSIIDTPKESTERGKGIVVGLSDAKNTDEDIRKRGKKKQRPSYVRKRIIAMEKEISFHNTNRIFTRIFTPDFYKRKVAKPEDKKDKKPLQRYLSPTMATIFLISVLTGSAISTIPHYLNLSNWFGVFLIILLGLNAMYAGLCIGWSWIIIEEMWPEHIEYSRIPYQDMAYRAMGKCMKYFVAFNVDVSILGVCAVYIILIADSIENLTYQSLQFCHLLVIMTVVLLPFTMFGSYRNIRWIGILDVLLSVSYTFFLIISFFLDKPPHGNSSYSNTDFNSLVISFAGFSFAYGCGAPLSNILLDMEDRTMFTQSCATAFMIVTVIYILLSMMGYAAYGDETPTYILQMVLTNNTYRNMGIFIGVLYILQLMTSFVCFVLPSLLAFEVRMNCPDRFGLFRFVLRLFIVTCLLLLILGLPYISRYVEIVGATSMNLTTFIFPPICYVFLVYQRPHSKRHISKKEWFLIIETVLLGITVAVVTLSRFEIVALSPKDRSSCYVNMTEISVSKLWMMNRRP